MKRKEEPLSDTEQYQLLSKVDLSTAIHYFGVTELLDTIGVAEIERYLAYCREDRISPVGSVRPKPVLKPVNGGKVG